jgi:hypothetical protein
MEVTLHRRQRDVHRREVVGDHEDRQAHAEEREPGAAVDPVPAVSLPCDPRSVR